jgi:PII-like signaling protein
MNWETVAFVRIYLTEADKTLEPLLKKLHDQETVRGVTVFRAMSGFGGSGVIHTTSLVDLSLDLPITVEFFDSPDKVDGILAHLSDMLEGGHIVRWQAEMNTADD